MDWPQINIENSMKLKGAAVAAAEHIKTLCPDHFQSITITVQARSEGFYAVHAIIGLSDGTAMRFYSEEPLTTLKEGELDILFL